MLNAKKINLKKAFFVAAIFSLLFVNTGCLVVLDNLPTGQIEEANINLSRDKIYVTISNGYPDGKDVDMDITVTNSFGQNASRDYYVDELKYTEYSSRVTLILNKKIPTNYKVVVEANTGSKLTGKVVVD